MCVKWVPQSLGPVEGSRPTRLRRGPGSEGLTFCCHHVEILNNVEQGVLCFHSALGPSNYVASPEPSKC